MRALKFLFISFIVIAVSAVVTGLIAREVILTIASYQVRSDISTLRKIQFNPARYAQECLARGATAEAQVIEQFQLRFTSDQDYVLEVVCSQFRLDPIVVSRHQLPLIVSKQPGSGGIILGDLPSGITLELYGRSRSIGVVNGQTVFQRFVAEEVSLGPATSCQGYGFECCNPDLSQGLGDQFTGVNDCPRTCFASCQQRPAVLSFSADPGMDLQTRTVEMVNNQPLTFNYVLNANGLPFTAQLDFGDGQVEPITELISNTTHTYTCPQSECVYTARISITDQNQVTSATPPLSQLQIVVRR